MVREVIKTDRDLFSRMYTCFNEFQEKFDKIYSVEILNDTLNEIYNRNVAVTPIFRKRPEWECSTCRSAIRQVARAVAIDNNYRRISFLEYFLSKYDISTNYLFFEKMFKEMDAVCKESPIKGFFYSKDAKIGVEKSLESGTGLVFTHFHFDVFPEYQRRVDVNDRYNGLKAVVTKYAEYPDVLRDVLFYIEQGYVYRGNEKVPVLQAALNLLSKYDKDSVPLEEFIWKHINDRAAYFNSDVISTLVDDIINGVDIDRAIEEYNRKVSPENYRQTKVQVVSPVQIKSCEKDLEALGFKDFVNGFSFAEPRDLSVLDVIWTNRKVSSRGSLTDILANNIKKAPVSRHLKNARKIEFDEFIKTLKGAKTVEVDTGTLAKMVLVKDTFEKPVFAWGNHINYCYETGLADVDEVSQRVKSFGGNIDAAVRFSLGWDNLDDLDLHMKKDKNVHIYYGHKIDQRTNFQLDIDMNVENPVRGAVENIFAKKTDSRDDGEYTVYVHNYSRREKPQRCILNVYLNNKIVKQFQFENPPYDESIELVKFKIEKGQFAGFTWTNKQYEVEVKQPGNFVQVDTVLLSPNYWQGEKGNKHVFFLKKGESIELGNIRPYNIEHLRPELVKHRKVLQLLSNRIEIKGKPQLIGWGISFAKKRELNVRVDGRPYRVVIDPSKELNREEVFEEKQEKESGFSDMPAPGI